MEIFEISKDFQRRDVFTYRSDKAVITARLLLVWLNRGQNANMRKRLLTNLQIL